MNVVTPLLAKGLPIGIVLNALSKISPQMKNFIVSAGASGLGAAEIVDFIKRQADLARGNPLEYQERKTAPRDPEQLAVKKKHEETATQNLLQGATGMVAGVAGGLAGVQGLGGQETEKQPIQEQPQTDNAAIVDADKERAKQMIREGVKGFRAQQEAPAEGKEEDWPKLRDFIKKMLTMGKTPEETVQQANRISGFRPLIEEFERKHGIVFEDAIRHLFGGQIQQAAQQTPQQAPQAAGPSAGDQAIMQAMANFSKLLKK